MKDKTTYKELTGKELPKHDIKHHQIVTYVDDTQHPVASKQMRV